MFNKSTLSFLNIVNKPLANRCINIKNIKFHKTMGDLKGFKTSLKLKPPLQPTDVEFQDIIVCKAL